MKPVPAIVEADMDLVEKQLMVAIADYSGMQNQIARLEGKLESTREAAKIRRLEIGRLLVRARAAYPERGPNAKPWGELLRRIQLPESTAKMYMDEYRDPKGFAERSAKTPRPGPEVAPDSEPDTAPPDYEPDPEVEIDRDTWCTPKWITDAIGHFQVDPCANERSHVDADVQVMLEREQDGLLGAELVHETAHVFINPPYSDVTPWIKAYAHTRFCFLLKLDPSTKWFAELYKHTELILIPRGTRVEFEAPPGVPRDKQNANPFPHALFYRFADDATPAIRELCFAWRVEH